MIEPWLRDILRCPQCRSPLSDGTGPSGPELPCTNAADQRRCRRSKAFTTLLLRLWTSGGQLSESGAKVESN